MGSRWPGQWVTTKGWCCEGPAAGVEGRSVPGPKQYGELADEFVFVGPAAEFDHPSGEANVRVLRGQRRRGRQSPPPPGAGGQFGSSKILLSQDITNDSRVLFTGTPNGGTRCRSSV
jgi:hypothetical protein